MRRKGKNAWIGERFDKEIDEIVRQRFSDVDKNLRKPIAKSRLMDKIPEYPEWQNIKKRLREEPRKEDIT